MSLLKQERKLTFPPPVCPTRALGGLDAAYPTLVRVIFFNPFIDLNANLFQKHPYRLFHQLCGHP